jgi:hypothetical protein
MTTTDQQKRQMAEKTYKLLCTRLPLNTVCHPDRDPCKLLKKHPMRFHVRVLPIKRKPVGFWFENGCYYEILVGPSEERPDSIGSVQFFRFVNQKKFGGNKFTKQVSHILKSAEYGAPQGFNLIQDRKFHFEKYYYGKEFPCDIAAKDLAWLISKTLHMFQAL